MDITAPASRWSLMKNCTWLLELVQWFKNKIIQSVNEKMRANSSIFKTVIRNLQTSIMTQINGLRPWNDLCHSATFLSISLFNLMSWVNNNTLQNLIYEMRPLHIVSQTDPGSYLVCRYLDNINISGDLNINSIQSVLNLTKDSISTSRTLQLLSLRNNSITDVFFDKQLLKDGRNKF